MWMVFSRPDAETSLMPIANLSSLQVFYFIGIAMS